MDRSSKKIRSKLPRRSPGSIALILGVMFLLAGLLLSIHPHYTFAGPADTDGDQRCRITASPDALFKLGNLNPGDSYSRTLTIKNEGELPAYLWLTHEWVDGNPLPGEQGDLFSQLVMTISWRGITLYHGPLEGLEELLNISIQIGPLRPGQSLDLDFDIFLPGQSTGNDFQGSTVTTRMIILTACGDGTEEPPEKPGTDPRRLPLPQTEGFTPALLILLGLSLVVLGVALKKRSKPA